MTAGRSDTFWKIVALDVEILAVLGVMAASTEALDLFHIVFLLMVVEAFQLKTAFGFWTRLVAALGTVEFLLLRPGGAAWKDLAEPFVLATIASLVFWMHTTRDRARAELRDQATHDALTGVLNWRAFQTHLDAAVARLHREHLTFAVIYSDLDGFKTVNDTHGHDIGDSVLIAAAKRVSDVTRDTDMVCRIGGDEFAVLLGSAVSANIAEDIARRLVAQFVAPIVVGELTINLTASMGIAMATPASKHTPQELLSEADRAMDKVKQEDRGTYAFSA